MSFHNKTPEDRVRAEDAKGAQANLDRAFAEGSARGAEIVAEIKAGLDPRVVPLAELLAAIETDARIAGLASPISDSDAKSALAYAWTIYIASKGLVSVDARTPIAMFLGLAELIQRREAQVEQEEQAILLQALQALAQSGVSRDQSERIVEFLTYLKANDKGRSGRTADQIMRSLSPSQILRVPEPHRSTLTEWRKAVLAGLEVS